MKILFYGLNYAPELTGTGKYTGEMCEWMALKGHEVRAVASMPYYPNWRIYEEYRHKLYQREERNGVQVFRSWLYVPRKPGAVSRILHLISFALLSPPLLLRQWKWRPQVIIGVEPTLFCAPFILLSARLFGAKTILHIQDYEIDVLFGLGMAKVGVLSKTACKIECWLMQRFDLISTISQTMKQRAKDKVGRESNVTILPNWVDIDFVRPRPRSNVLRKRWEISSNMKVVLYSGNMGKKQGMRNVVEAASQMQFHTDVVFILVGTGVVRRELEQAAMKRGLRNIRFMPLVPYDELPDLMALGDVHLVLQEKGVAEALLPSKLATILAAGGNALITAEPNTELANLCVDFPGIAWRTEPENIRALIMSLERMLENVDVDRRNRNDIARSYAESHLDKNRVLAAFENHIKRICLNA